jgi:hypothetical protein
VWSAKQLPGTNLQPPEKLPEREKELSSPKELRRQDRQAERNDEDGRAGKNDECYPDPEDTQTDHGHRGLARQAKR